MIKGMNEWINYLVKELGLIREDLVEGTRYTLPAETGKGYMQSCEEPGHWVVWQSDFVLYKELQTTYIQEELSYLSFVYKETTYPVKVPDANWPSKEVIHFQSFSGMMMRSAGIFFFTPYFERLTNWDVMDFIASMQSYRDETFMKPITPILRQIYEYSGKGLSKRLFIESKVLETASILVEMAEHEKGSDKIYLSAFDSSQLYKVLEILEERMTDPPSIGELSKITAMNEYKLKAGFRQLFSTTIYEYLRLLRMEKAAELLDNQELSLQEIGQRVGYQSPHGFSNAFRRYYGITPLEWQRRKDGNGVY